MTQEVTGHTDLGEAVAACFDGWVPQRLAVAVSGGGDSLALLHLLADWARHSKTALSVVTVDHGLRPQSAQEAAFVADVAADLGLNHQTLRWTGWDRSGNLQDAARRARYALMADWARDHGIEAIALGHTADDQAETFLMRLARSAGIDGLTGMQPRRLSQGVLWARPLLTVRRDSLRWYLKDLEQRWIDDPSNEDDTFDRVKMRRVMGLVAEVGLTPEALGRVMTQLGDVQAALDQATLSHAKTCMRQDQGDLIIDRRGFSAGAREVNRRLIEAALRWIASAEYGPRGAKLQEFLSAMMRGRDATLHGVRLVTGKDSFRLTREYAAVADATSVPGVAWDRRWIVDVVDEAIDSERLIVKPLGQEGLLQLGDLPADAPPRVTLSASPALFHEHHLVAAPLAGHGTAQARLVPECADFFSILLSH